MIFCPEMTLHGALLVLMIEVPAWCSGAPSPMVLAEVKPSSFGGGQLAKLNPQRQSEALVSGDGTLATEFQREWNKKLKQGGGNAIHEMTYSAPPVTTSKGGYETTSHTKFQVGRFQEKKSASYAHGGSLKSVSKGGWARQVSTRVTAIPGLGNVDVLKILQRAQDSHAPQIQGKNNHILEIADSIPEEARHQHHPSNPQPPVHVRSGGEPIIEEPDDEPLASTKEIHAEPESRYAHRASSMPTIEEIPDEPAPLDPQESHAQAHPSAEPKKMQTDPRVQPVAGNNEQPILTNPSAQPTAHNKAQPVSPPKSGPEAPSARETTPPQKASVESKDIPQTGNLKNTLTLHHPEVTPTQEKYFLEFASEKLKAEGKDPSHEIWNQQNVEELYNLWKSSKKQWKFKIINFWDQTFGKIWNLCKTLGKKVFKGKSD